MNFEIDTKRFQEDLRKIGERLGQAVKDRVISDAMTAGGNFIKENVQENRLTGPRPDILGVRSGRLKGSITVADTEKKGNTYETRIGTNVKYARIHEFGGTIRAKNSPFLKFKIGKEWKQVREVTIPARPFLKPVIESRFVQNNVINILTNRINRALEKK